jgi:hypothetical protein
MAPECQADILEGTTSCRKRIERAGPKTRDDGPRFLSESANTYKRVGYGKTDAGRRDFDPAVVPLKDEN